MVLGGGNDWDIDFSNFDDRLAADHEARAMILRKWRQEWEPQLLGFQHEKLSTGTAVVVHDPGFV